MKKKRIMLIAAVSAVILAVALAFFLWPDNTLQKAFDEKRYGTVQVRTTLKSEYTGPKDETGEDTEYAGIDPEYETSFVENLEEKDITTMQKHGDVICETGEMGDLYYYTRDGKGYVLYYYDLYGALEQGQWIECPAEVYGKKPEFEVSALSGLSKKDFVKQGEGYIPVSDSTEKVFRAFFGVGEESYKKYVIYDLQITVQDNRMETVTIKYLYDGLYSNAQTLYFTYDDIKPTVPPVDETYEEFQSKLEY